MNGWMILIGLALVIIAVVVWTAIAVWREESTARRTCQSHHDP